jgi:hypothetical protein
MSVKIKLKHSSVVNKAPLPTDLDAGELALNTNSGSPAAYIKDSAGNIVKLAGAGAIGGTPATETAQGIVELATAAETAAGTDNTRAVHPAGLKATGATYINTATTPAVINVWNGTAWVPQAGTAVTGGTAPGTPAAGQIWVDTSGAAPATKIWDGTSWVTMTVDTGTQAKLDAQVASVWTRKGTTLLPATTGDLVVADVLPDATATSKGAVQLADAVAVTAGTAGRVVDAAQLKAAVAVENNWDRSSPTGAGALTVTTGSSAITATGAALQNIAVTSSSGAGTGLRVNLTVTGGAVTAASVAATGSGYAVNDTVTIAKAGVAGAAVDIVLKVSGLSGGVVSPANAGDQVHTGTGKLTVGGTAAAPNLQIKADGGIVANTDGLVYDAATKRLAIGTTAPLDRLHIASTGECKLIIGNEQTNTDGIKRSAIIKKADNDLEIRATESAAAGATIFTRTVSAESARIDSSGRLLVGTSSGGGVARLQVQGSTIFNDAFLDLCYNGSGSIAANTNLGVLRFTDQASNANIFAQIACATDAAANTGDYPSRLVFSTTADGASSPTERMRITSGGVTRFVGSVDIEIDPSKPAIYRTGANMAGIHFSTNSILPSNNSGSTVDNTQSLGNGTWRWSVVYAGTGTINTSDAGLKQDVESLSTAELAVAVAIKSLIKKYRFKDAIASKGSDARIHVGVVAQEVEQAFIAAGLEPRRYGLFCEDELEDGTKRLGIRYDEILAFVVAAL